MRVLFHDQIKVLFQSVPEWGGTWLATSWQWLKSDVTAHLHPAGTSSWKNVLPLPSPSDARNEPQVGRNEGEETKWERLEVITPTLKCTGDSLSMSFRLLPPSRKVKKKNQPWSPASQAAVWMKSRTAADSCEARRFGTKPKAGLEQLSGWSHDGLDTEIWSLKSRRLNHENVQSDSFQRQLECERQSRGKRVVHCVYM